MIKSIWMTCLFLSFSTAGASTHFKTNYVELDDKYNNGYTEARYESVLDQVIELYSPVIVALGGSFHILRDWSDGAVNMWAFKLGSEYWLEIPGGMSRYNLISEEGFLMSICHELGHLLGGAPFKGNGDISLEGQSDHFAGRDCIDFVLENIEPFKEIKLDPEVVGFCADLVGRKDCERSVSGALSLTSYYAELEKVPAPKISTPSKVVVGETLRTHPPAQCRLDSFLAGYLGIKRPACWFKKEKRSL